MIAALFVEEGGVYYGLPNVDPWPESRDARKYAGPWSVVAHPDCARWGRYWSGGPSARVPRVMGDDGGCFENAIYAVRSYGGVLEHPEGSHAFNYFGITRKPPRGGGWVVADAHGGFACCVEQGHYGHRARKATWLYVNAGCIDRGKPFGPHVSLPELIWGPSTGERLDEGFHSKAERDAARAAGQRPRPRLSRAENIRTPIPFRDLLISIAEGVQKKSEGTP